MNPFSRCQVLIFDLNGWVGGGGNDERSIIDQREGH
jgi:hypothetical protein